MDLRRAIPYVAFNSHTGIFHGVTRQGINWPGIIRGSQSNQRKQTRTFNSILF